VALSWRPDGCGFTIRNRSVDLREVRSIWLRRPVAPALSASSEALAAWITSESVEALRGVWRTYGGLWVNHPDASYRASSKLEQLRRAQHISFQVPDSLVTNDPAALRDFRAQAEAPLICKPIRSGYVPASTGRDSLFFTTLINDSDLDEFGDGGPEPYLFQRLIEKDFELRVTVIGEEVFAVRLDSQEHEDTRVDWRRGDQQRLQHTAFDLPPAVRARCKALVTSYGLLFSAIDLAVDKHGRYVFFEINPDGQWAWLEQRTGLPMRAALADVLFGESNRRS
jgi:glutathione synthase/RimK-type ligase-like ATP-grasp enzyme